MGGGPYTPGMRAAIGLILAMAASLLAPASASATTPHPCDLWPGPSASAGGAPSDELRIHWDDCSVTGHASKSFACDESAGPPFAAYLSLVLDRPMPHLRNFFLDLWVFTDSTRPLEDWWRLTSCRGTAFSTGSFPIEETSCTELSDLYTLGAGGSDYIEGAGFPNAGRLRFAYDVEAIDSMRDTLPAFTEITVFRLSFPRRSPSGRPICSGCEKPACIWFGQASLEDATQSDVRWITGSSASLVRWQEGSLDTGTPARVSSWGRLKSVYR